MTERFQAVLSDRAVPEAHVFGSPAHGAEVQFRGVVREREGGRKLAGIRYTAYEAMAEAKLREIAAAAAASRPDALVFIHHVLGYVAAGAPSVLIAVAMPHSAEALALCAEVLRRLKSEVPIWKEPRWDGA
jgi:molybdopterin synthase catalytic subunit